MPIYSLHFIKTLETRRIKRFPAKTFTNVGMVQRVIKNDLKPENVHLGAMYAKSLEGDES